MSPEADRATHLQHSHCWLQETSGAVDLATIFSISRTSQTAKVSSTIVTHSPSSNIHLCPASLPRHHPHSSSVGCMNSRQLPPNSSVETPLHGCALLTPFSFSSVPFRHELMSRHQEATHIALEWASTYLELTPQPWGTGTEESLHGAVASACSQHR